jgi:hypothetical protein
MEKKEINEANINGSKVFVENGEVKTILSEEVQKTGYMQPEMARELLHVFVNKLQENYGQE